MTGASIEATLELWACSLRNVKARIRPLFSQERVALSAGQNEGRADATLGTDCTNYIDRLRALVPRRPGPGSP
jgi:hypothetical protein